MGIATYLLRYRYPLAPVAVNKVPVDAIFAVSVLRWLGFDIAAGHVTYDRHQAALGLRPDYVVHGPVDTAFIWEDNTNPSGSCHKCPAAPEGMPTGITSASDRIGMIRRGLPADTTLNATVTGRPDELYIYDESGIRLCSLHDVARSLLPKPGVDLPTTRLIKVFDEPAYFPINGVDGWERVKVRAISYDISVAQGGTITAISSVEDVIAYILEDTLSGTTKHIDRGLQMRS